MARGALHLYIYFIFFAKEKSRGEVGASARVPPDPFPITVHDTGSPLAHGHRVYTCRLSFERARARLYDVISERPFASRRTALIS